MGTLRTGVYQAQRPALLTAGTVLVFSTTLLRPLLQRISSAFLRHQKTAWTEWWHASKPQEDRKSLATCSLPKVMSSLPTTPQSATPPVHLNVREPITTSHNKQPLVTAKKKRARRLTACAT